MRVIGGEFRSRVIKTLPGTATRPTPDRLREALFNVLQLRIKDAVFIDAHAGSGAVGIEALSRGAKRAIFIERGNEAIAVVQDNLQTLRLGGRARVIQGSAPSHLKSQQGDIVFLDPPYDQPKQYEACFRVLGDDPPPLVIAQHATREKLEDRYGQLRRTRVIKQGDNSLSFYSPVDDAVGAQVEDAAAPPDRAAE
jgi:16S rRNA (guanine(966)-N(2))-methyltransferase RsmD